jgi:hypothetical protein
VLENVHDLRARWTPELTELAVRFLQGAAVDYTFGTVKVDGVDYVDLRGLSVEQEQFDGAHIRHVNLRWSKFRDVGFKDAVIEHCMLSHTDIDASYMRRTQFLACDLVNTKFTLCDFPGARFVDCRLDFTHFKQCELRISSFQFRQDASPLLMVRLCRNLKLNAMSMGHYADASDLTYLEKTYERHVQFREAFGTENQTPLHRGNAAVHWVWSCFLSAFWGYGERPARLLFAMAFFVVAFGTVQYLLGAVPDRTYAEHLYFSGITFLTVGYGDLVPVTPLTRALAIAEGTVGVATFGLLIASATKKIMYR